MSLLTVEGSTFNSLAISSLVLLLVCHSSAIFWRRSEIVTAVTLLRLLYLLLLLA